MKIDILKLEQLRQMNMLDGDKELCFVNQVRTRIKWLREKLEERLHLSKGYYEGDKEDIIHKTINEAFEDVTIKTEELEKEWKKNTSS